SGEARRTEVQPASFPAESTRRSTRPPTDPAAGTKAGANARHLKESRQLLLHSVELPDTLNYIFANRLSLLFFDYLNCCERTTNRPRTLPTIFLESMDRSTFVVRI